MKYSFDSETLVWGNKKIAPSIRKLSDMVPVLAYPKKAISMRLDAPTYYMYRSVEQFGKIRYDITKLLAIDLCGEKNKTFGHSHPSSPSGAPWPEVYEVLSGNAHFLLQKSNSLGVQDAVLLDAKKGDCLIIPPGYGHVTINASKKELVLGNLVSSEFNADYSQFLRMRGACFYELSDGKLKKNENYGIDFEIRKLKAKEFSASYGVYAFFKKGLLDAARSKKSIEFLEKPELFY